MEKKINKNANSDLKMLEVKDSDVDNIIGFHNKTYSDKRLPEHWRWEYKGNYPELFVFVIIKDKGQVVGTQGMIPICINIFGKSYLSGKSESSLLDHRYRGGTLFQDLYEFGISKCKSNKMYCIWGFTSASGVWKKKLKFKLVRTP